MKRNFESLKNRLSIKGAGKVLLLLAGVGLCGMVVLEASQQMVKAFDLKNVLVQPDRQSSVQPVPAIGVTLPKAQTRSPQAHAVQPGAVQPGAARSKPSQSLDFGIDQPAAQSSARSTAHSAAQPKTLALNSGSANDPQQPVSQASASQIATAGSGWTGGLFSGRRVSGLYFAVWLSAVARWQLFARVSLRFGYGGSRGQLCAELVGAAKS